MDSKGFCKKKVSGYFPDYGAIFISNKSTMKECFEKCLFGLPDSFSGFVKNVKEGMILFLFEFEERKLYGVFQAVSDGGMDLVPHAYVSSGKKFPAQVKFTRFLDCYPLFEDEFCDVIQDNYFSPYKFNFGLTKDQTQSLIWLFNSRKREFPSYLHQKKRKNRKWDFQIIENVLQKGRFTNSHISKRKLNKNLGTSEQEVERLSLSLNSCKKCGIIHFDDDAYDPEKPSFNHSVGSELHSAASYESHKLPSLQKKKKKFRIPEEDTGDFIPLCSTDNSDLEDGELDDISECSAEQQIELDMLVGNGVSSIPIPRFLLNDEESNRLDKSLSPAVSNLQSNDENDCLNSLLSKGMYSDKPKKEPVSVFSRLNFPSEGTGSKNQNDTNSKYLVNSMSRAEHHYRYKYENVEEVTQKIENVTTNKRPSVFLRLAPSAFHQLANASDVVAPQIYCDRTLGGNWLVEEG